MQTAVTAVRLVMAIADAVRRQQERQQRRERALPPADQAMRETAQSLNDLFPADISAALLQSADWPQMAQQLLALRQAGVNLEEFLPRVGEIAGNVRDQVAANAERVAREGTEEWERALRETLPAGPVREAILSSPTWPDIAATMARLDERGVDVRQLLASAHDEGLGVDQAIAKVVAAAAPTTSRDALVSYGPLTTGLDLPVNLDLDNRVRALQQLAITEDNPRYVRWVMEAMPGHEREANLLVSAKQWPLIAAQMAKMESEGKPARQHLARLATDRSWENKKGPLGQRMVEAANDALRRPLGDAPAESRVRVNTAAARSQSTTVGPTSGQAKTAAPAGPAVAPHRQAGPAPSRGKAK
ncbi:hypothetical protein [Streptomyces cellostaticus]|uniref:hypothetical protein n=1 Tax=Streptomyces cellostaticus TaxID=67285 RepID=UPI00099F0BE9|nr:hypothetical protein [Streptomyces cellostaticus]